MSNRKKLETQEERLNKKYRKEGWGILAEKAGFNPYHTESSARCAFRFAYDIINTALNGLGYQNDTARLETLRYFISSDPIDRLQVGDKVQKVSGSVKFPGTIVAVYQTLAGEDRVVVECTIPDVAGLQHIYRPDQLEVLPK